MLKKGKDLKVFWNSFVASGDELAYRELYAHYHQYFFYIGIKRGALSAKIGDCIHDLFLYLFENRDKLHSVKDHHNFLVTLFIRALFKKQRFSVEESEDLEAAEDFQPLPGVDENLMAKDTGEQVRSILDTYLGELSATQSRMIYEKFYLGLSYQEIADAHQVTVRTVYTTTFKGIDKLRKLIGENKIASLITALTSLSVLLFYLMH